MEENNQTFYDTYVDVVEAASNAVETTSNAISSNNDFGVILLVGFLAMVLILGMFWLGFTKAMGMYISSKGGGNQAQPTDPKNLAALLVYPIMYLFFGMVIYIMASKITFLVWDLDFSEQIKLFMEFKFENYQTIVDEFATGKELGKFLTTLLDVLARLCVFLIVFTAIFIFVASGMFSITIASNTSLKDQRDGVSKIVLIIISTMIVSMIVFTFYYMIIDEIFLEMGVSRGSVEYFSLSEMISSYAKEAVVSGLNGTIVK